MESQTFKSFPDRVTPSFIQTTATQATHNIPNYQTPAELTKELESNKKECQPMVYIDVPELVENPASSTATTPDTDDVEGVIERTIFYDPFNDRILRTTAKPFTIETHGNYTRFPGGNPTSFPGGNPTRLPGGNIRGNLVGTFPGPSRPAPAAPGSSRNPPATLDLLQQRNRFELSPYQPSRHQVSPEDEFYLSPLTLDHPAPPPAYSEAIGIINQNTPQASDCTVHIDPPSDLTNTSRKFLFCSRCTKRVHTVTAWSSGWFTYILGTITLTFCLLPCLALVCISNMFKQRDHYCPNCNEKIGYEVPLLCYKMILVSK